MSSELLAFRKDLLDGNSVSNTSPSFRAISAQDFFSSQFLSQPHKFSLPSWMPPPADPKYEMPCLDPISTDELLAAIKRSRSSSAPSPLDQVPYRIFKNCPSLTPALLDLFNSVITEGSVPSSWKCAVFNLLGKSAASDDPVSPSSLGQLH